MNKTEYFKLFKVILVSNVKALPKLLINASLIFSITAILLKLTNVEKFSIIVPIFISVFISVFISGFVGSFIKRCLLVELDSQGEDVSIDGITPNKAFLNIIFTFLILIALMSSFGFGHLISFTLGLILIFCMLLVQII